MSTASKFKEGETNGKKQFFKCKSLRPSVFHIPGLHSFIPRTSLSGTEEPASLASEPDASGSEGSGGVATAFEKWALSPAAQEPNPCGAEGELRRGFPGLSHCPAQGHHHVPSGDARVSSWPLPSFSLPLHRQSADLLVRHPHLLLDFLSRPLVETRAIFSRVAALSNSCVSQAEYLQSISPLPWFLSDLYQVTLIVSLPFKGSQWLPFPRTQSFHH